MKQWPEDERKIVPVDELLPPITKAIRAAFTLKSKGLKSIPYDGYTTGPATNVCSPPPDQHLNEEGLAYAKARGRDALDLLVMISYQLGVENGRRVAQDEIQAYKLSSDTWQELASNRKSEHKDMREALKLISELRGDWFRDHLYDSERAELPELDQRIQSLRDKYL